MGNIGWPTDKLSTSEVSKEDYMRRRVGSWSHQEGYLYQTQLTRVEQNKLKVVTLNLDLRDLNITRYFERLKMMGRYLTCGNLQLPLLCINMESNDCSCNEEDGSSVQFYYEPYDILLSEQVIARQRYGQNFSQPELWYIVFSMLNAIKQFEPFSQPSGNLTLSQIMMNPNGEIRLKTSLSQPHVNSSEQLQSYYSPQELFILKRSYGRQGPLSRQLYRQFNINPNICQVFSLAVTILSLATFSQTSIFYFIPSLQMNQHAFDYALNMMASLKYSRLFCNLIRVMLSNYHNRPLPTQIYEMFRPYEYQILHFLPFSFRPTSR